MQREDGFHLGRVDVVAAADVHVGGPADDGEVPVLAQIPEVTADQPPLAVEGGGGQLGLVPVAAHDAAAPDPYLTGLAGWPGDRYLHALLGAADRAELDVRRVGWLGASDRRALGHRVPDDDGEPEPLGDLLDNLGPYRRGRGRADADVRQVDVIDVGQPQQALPLGRD